jgi:hypothetical protein
VAGEYWVQTLINSSLFHEQPLIVTDVEASQAVEPSTETVN